MIAHTATGWHIKTHPGVTFQASDLELRRYPLPMVRPGEIGIRMQYLSLDPAYRVWASGRNMVYLPPQPVGALLPGSGIGVVEESQHPDYTPGQIVAGLVSLADYNVVPGDFVLPVPSSIAPEEYYAYYGHTGATAYFGLELAKPRPNDVLVVSSAAGGVGALVGQMGKCVGCSHVIGIAGSDERCRWIVEELGFDAAINYTREHVAERLQELCPAGIDIYFDNVGGGLLDTVLTMLARNARIALCGELATYNTPASSAITNTFQLTLQRASMHGFLVTDYLSRYAEAFDQITVWRTQGRMRTGLTILDGIEQLAPALERLFAGAYLGKVVIRV